MARTCTPDQNGRPIAVLGLVAVLAACGPKAPPPVLEAPEVTARGLAAIRTLPAPYNTADPAAGREALALCVECHNFKAGGVAGKGPSLAGIIGAPAAAKPGFAYSVAMKNSGIVWDVRRLDHFLFNPPEAVRATSMSFIGIRNDKKRHDLLAYLVAVSGEPEP